MIAMQTTLLAIFGLPGGTEWIFLAVLALLIFGKRLPNVARSLGKSFNAFKKGLTDEPGEDEPSVDEDKDEDSSQDNPYPKE